MKKVNKRVDALEIRFVKLEKSESQLETRQDDRFEKFKREIFSSIAETNETLDNL